MKMSMKLLGVSLMTAFIFTSCTKDAEIAPVEEISFATQGLLPGETVRSADNVVSNFVSSKANPKGLRSLAILADCYGYATIGTPANFKPAAGNFDELYTGASFMNGVGAISESKPGDQDYNGGRWHVNTLKAGVDPNKYQDACSVEDLDLYDFESTTTYFECPLRPLR